MHTTKLLLFTSMAVCLLFLLNGASPQVEAATNENVDYPAEDSFAHQNDSGTPQGSATYFITGYNTDSAEFITFITYGLENVTPGATIDNATLYMFSQAIGGSGKWCALYRSDNIDWEEHIMDWNDMPDNVTGSTVYDNVNVTAADTWYQWDATALVQAAIDDGDNAVTVAFDSDHLSGAAEYVFFDSRETAGTDHPTLDITFTPAAVFATITIDNIAVDNGISSLSPVDRDNDGYLTVDSPQGTTILARVTDNNGLDNLVHARVTVYAGDDTKLVDNGAFDNYTDENSTTRLYEYRYYPADAITDVQLGGFDVEVEIHDIDGFDNTLKENLIFYVDDFTVVANVDNTAGHNTNVTGSADLISSDVSPEYVTIVDSVFGTYRSTLDDNAFDNTYYRPTAANYYAYAFENGVDGLSSTVSYEFPNLTPGIVSIIVDNALIDNHRDDNAITATRIEVIFEDNDNYTDFHADNFWIAVRDFADYVWENDNAAATAVLENENYAVLSFTYDAEENTDIPEVGMGVWDVNPQCSDNWSSFHGWTTSVFTVDEIVIPINIRADNTTAGLAYGFDLVVAGVTTRRSGSAISIDNLWIIDENINTTLAQDDNNGYTENWTIQATPETENLFIRVWCYDGVLDGENYGYYDVSDNRLYTVEVRWEENYDLVTDLTGDNGDFAVDNRGYHLKFFFDNYAREFDMTTSQENYIVTDEPYKIKLEVNDNGPPQYWRMRIPTSPGTVTFTVPENVDNLRLYTFFLTDMTGLFGSNENGRLHLTRFYENSQMVINEDYWNSSQEVYTWLIYGKQYDARISTDDRERATSPATVSDEDSIEVTIGTYRMPLPLEIWDHVWYTAYWNSDNDIYVAYRDNQENTVGSRLRIIDENQDLVYESTFTTDNWTATWTSAIPTTGYTIWIDIEHENYADTFGGENISVKTALTSVWVGILSNNVIPGTSALGTTPIAFSSAFGLFFAIIVGLTFGKRHAGLAILSIALFLVVLGPLMGMFVLPEIVIPFIATIGILVMLIPRRGA